VSKVAITCAGNRNSSLFDRRFGRAAWYCLFDDISGNATYIKNENCGDLQQTGIKASEKMIGLEVKKIISGDFGPFAMDLLKKFNIQMVILQDSQLTVQEIINKLIKK
jgi:predicted Fe-Mo cluster-binding NifX family protein